MNIVIGVKALADLLGVDRKTIYNYMKLGLPHYQVSKCKKAFNVDEVISWLERAKR